VDEEKDTLSKYFRRKSRISTPRLPISRLFGTTLRLD
jgi:hypothetical protein